MQKIPQILRHIKVNHISISYSSVNKVYFATNFDPKKERIGKHSKSREELAKELSEIKSRIGKVEPVKAVHEDLKKQEIESNKRYLEKWWLKMSIYCTLH